MDLCLLLWAYRHVAVSVLQVGLTVQHHPELVNDHVQVCELPGILGLLQRWHCDFACGACSVLQRFHQGPEAHDLVVSPFCFVEASLSPFPFLADGLLSAVVAGLLFRQLLLRHFRLLLRGYSLRCNVSIAPLPVWLLARRQQVLKF